MSSKDIIKLMKDKQVEFVEHVQPILELNCVACHYENDTFWRLGPPGGVRGAPGGGPGSARDAIPYR